MNADGSEYIICNKDGWYLRRATLPHLSWANDRHLADAVRANQADGVTIVNWINERHPRTRASLRPVFSLRRLLKEAAAPDQQGSFL